MEGGGEVVLIVELPLIQRITISESAMFKNRLYSLHSLNNALESWYMKMCIACHKYTNDYVKHKIINTIYKVKLLFQAMYL